MCSPLAVAGIGISAIGSGLAAKDAYDQGQQQGAAFDKNAAMARLAARDTVLRGAVESGSARMDGSRASAATSAMAAAAGVDPSSGSAADAAVASKVNAELDARTIQNNAAREAWGLRRQAVDMETQGRRAREAGKKAAVGAILGGLSGAASSGYGAYKAGG